MARTLYLNLLTAGGVLAVAGTSFADWPQWRGPERNGVASDSPRLASTWPEDGPPLVWSSEEIPNGSGQGSPIVWDGRTYLFVNWQRDVALGTRTIDSRVLRELHYFDKKEMPKELLAAMEEARRPNVERRPSRVLNKWAKEWVASNVPEDQKRWRSVIERRLSSGREAMSLETLAKLGEVKGREFPDHAALQNWVNERGFSDDERVKILEAVPTTKSVADDVALCFRSSDGKPLWKRTLPGKRDTNMASSTPSLVDGRLYFLGTTHAHCLDAQTGKPVWDTELLDGASASSLLITDNLVIGLAGRLVAFDRESGERVWRQEDVRGRKSSPALWRRGGTEYVLVNADRKELTCVEAATGKVVWSVPGGGESTPVVAGDMVVVHTNDDALGLVAYRLAPGGGTEVWRVPGPGRGASSPVVHEGRVYLAGSGRLMCVRLEDGHVHWDERGRAEISSPFLADGKLFALLSNGSDLVALDASPEAYRELAEARVRVERCPSPAFSEGRVILRGQRGISCYDLRADVVQQEKNASTPHP